GTYDGIHRNVMRESSGNPQAINLWDSNAAAGTPSKGLLQVIEPTFLAYHVPGTSMDLFDPVANITAACNYAADRYGSIDNVNGAY
ncbi:transglycosylase SLT domain-containing protein, partial [Streptomyces wedmorensis]